MKKAYEETIWDLEVELRNTSFFNFKRSSFLKSEIKLYEDKINLMLLNSGELDL
jgi:hypothetical protein|tara:strand:+ start:2224 stop:2385 length:162 start_codon:yes stop_codon:yes gene_type:complete